MLLIALVVPLLVPSQTPEWRREPAVDGMEISLRAVTGSSFEEIQVATTSTEPLDALCDAVWNKNRPTKPEGDFKKQVVIRETDTERWTYEQIHVAVVSDRDYVMVVKLLQPAATGRCEISFETQKDDAYPPTADHVRIPAIRGHWSLVPAGEGKVTITYQVFSDPGGSVPSFLARGGQRSAAVSFLKTILARAKSRGSTAPR